MMSFLLFIYLIFTLLVLAQDLPIKIWKAGTIVLLVMSLFLAPFWCAVFLWAFFAAIFMLIFETPVRSFISNLIYKKATKSVPRLSRTEEEALNAGDTWVEEDIFRGKPDWERLKNISTALSEEEQAFLDNEVASLCSMIDDWNISQTLDLPEDVWNFMKEKGFFGLVISKEYGGKGFSPRAHSDVVMKLASRSGVVAVTCMVPNSLGPGELLHYYGTEEQKRKYLPNLARGIDIPCFALTEPLAGSDATSIQSEAIVTKKEIDGKETVGLLIPMLEKRWITLAPVATLIGLAVNLKDPEGLLNGVGEEGITCLLIPRSTPNLEIGNRHLPTGIAFMNGTIRGKDIFVPIDSIVGGQKNAGHGWKMLVECLSIGRSISLPALSAALSGVSVLGSSAFSRIRRQFNMEIGRFEGVEERLARIAGLDYLINATRLLTIAAVNEHKKPSVASAITKYFNTEHARIVVNDGMDIHAGRAVVAGPRNYLLPAYLSMPIAITVEGANIMSRNLLIFGQGSMACHPFVRDEFYAIQKQDSALFKKLFWQHAAYFLQNKARAISSAWTFGFLLKAPKNPMHRDAQRLTRLSQAFAFIADFSILYLGKNLKRRERLSARLADGLSFLYMAMAVFRVAEESGWEKENLVYAKWALSYCFHETERALMQICRNFPSRTMGFLLKFLVFPFGQTMRYPSDKLDQKLARIMSSQNTYRDRLKKWLYLSGDSKQPLDKVEKAFEGIIALEAHEKFKDFLKLGSLSKIKEALHDKVKKEELSQVEMDHVLSILSARYDAILVDEFTMESMKSRVFEPVDL